MTENSKNPQPVENPISRKIDLPDFVNLLNKTSYQISIPSYAKKSNGEPRRTIAVPAHSSLRIETDDLQKYPIEKYQLDGSIVVEPVYPPFDIQNETARRIGIAPLNDQPLLVIPAFGTQRISRFLLNQYDYLPWQRRNLITVGRVEKENIDHSTIFSADFTFWIILFIIGFFVALIYFGHSETKPTPIVWQIYFAAMGLLLLVGIVGSIISSLQEGELVRFFNLILLITSAVLPIGVVLYFYGDVANLISADILSVATLGRGVQFFLIVLFALLPGLMYFQYDRQRVSAIRDRFFREIMQLNPNVVTREDARISYGSLVEEISGIVGATSRQYSLFGFGIPVLLSTWLISIGWLFALNPIGMAQWAVETPLNSFLSPSLSALNYAFLGAYFFALNLVFRRYVHGDLLPKAYNHITVRILSSVIFIWVISLFPIFNNLPPVYLTIFSFLVGVFPESGIAFIQDLARKRIFGKVFPSLQEKHPITDLEGVNLYDRVRLLEEGVESVENLVHYHPIELLLRTRMPMPRLIDLVDQAILYLHVRGKSEDSEAHQRTLRKLREYGIRTATDLLSLADSSSFKSNKPKPDQLKTFMRLLQPEKDGEPHRLEFILWAIRQNVWIDYLIHWRETNQARDKVFGLVDFYAQLAVGGPAEPSAIKAVGSTLLGSPARWK